MNTIPLIVLLILLVAVCGGVFVHPLFLLVLLLLVLVLV